MLTQSQKQQGHQTPVMEFNNEVAVEDRKLIFIMN